MLVNPPVSRWVFGYNEGNSKWTMEADCLFCREVVENFQQFMRGCGFSDQNLIDAFVAVLEEMESIQPSNNSHEES